MSLPSRMVSEIFLGCQQSTPGIVRHGACSAVAVAWHFKLCLDDHLGHTPVFSSHVPPACPDQGLGKEFPAVPRHMWVANNIITAPMWRRDVAQACGAKSFQICNDSLYQGTLPDLFLHTLKNAETFLSATSQKMSAGVLVQCFKCC